MAFSFRHLINTLLFALTAFASVTIVDAKPKATAKDSPIEFTVFARYRQKDLQFLPEAKRPPVPLEFFGNTRSPLYTFKGGSRIPFFNGEEITAWWEARQANLKDAPPMPAPVAIAEVPAGITRALLLFIPVRNAPAGSPSLQIYVVDDSPRTLPAGYAAVINASGREYKAKLGAELLDVPHGIGGKVPVKGTVELRLAAQDGNGWVVGGRHTFKLGENDRVSLVFFPPTSPTGIAPIIRTLIETIPDEPLTETSKR